MELIIKLKKKPFGKKTSEILSFFEAGALNGFFGTADIF